MRKSFASREIIVDWSVRSRFGAEKDGHHISHAFLDGTLVQSDGERRIAEWLTAHHINYRYDARLRIIEGFQIRPDFYLPEYDVYIEYWGMDTPRYKAGMYLKQDLYMHAGKRLISLYPDDKNRLDIILPEKLARLIHNESKR